MITAVRAPLVVVLVLVAATACDDDADEVRGPDGAALELFRLASRPEPDAAELDRLFGPAVDAVRRAALHDALQLLRSASDPRVLGSLALEEGGGRVVVDVEAGLSGNGSGRFSVVVEGAADEWRITWFQGPGVGWPPAPRRNEAGLRTSPPPTPSQVR